MADRTVSVRLLLNSAGFTAGARQASTAVAGVGARAQATAARATTGFRRMTAGVKAAGAGMAGMAAQAGLMRGGIVNPITAAGVAIAGVTKAAIDWESSFAGVQKTVDGTATQMAGLEDELRSMARELPATHGEIAAVAEAAGQLGIRREDIAGFTRTMIDLGETTNLSATQAATSIARFSNIMGTAEGDVDRLGSALVDLGNNSETTEAEILEFSTRLAAAGNIAGLSESDVLAFGAALTSVGVEAEAGGTALSKTFISIRDAVLTGSEQLDTFARVAGITASQFATAFREDPAQAIAMFIAGLGRMNDAGMSTTGVFEELELTDQRLMRALLSVASAGDLLTDSIELGSQAWEENTALTEEAQRRYDTAAAEIQVAWNKIKDAAIDAGEVIAPVFVELAERVADLVGFLSEADQQMQDFSGTFEGSGDHIERVKNVLRGFGIDVGEAGDQAEETAEQVEPIPGMLDLIAEQAGRAEGALAPAAEELDEFGRTAEEATEQLEAYLDELRAATDPVLALNNAFENVEQTQRDSKDAIRELERAQEDLDELRGDSEASARDLADAERRVEDAQRAVEESGWAVVEALSELEARALDGDLSFEDFSRKLDQWVEDGKITEGQARNMRDRVAELTGAAEDYQGDYNARVLLDNFRQVTSQLDGVERRAIEASKNRTMTITARAVTGGAERALQDLARPRTATIVSQTVVARGPAQVIGHEGGLVTTSGIRRFHDGGRALPRFHNGSARLRSDEVPAILQTGEMVLSRAQVAMMERARYLELLARGMIRLGDVTDDEWEQLKVLGWQGRAGDRMEALYPPLDNVRREFIKYGEVTRAEWQRLMRLGWQGKAGDRMEALYPPLESLAVEAGKAAKILRDANLSRTGASGKRRVWDFFRSGGKSFAHIFGTGETLALGQMGEMQAGDFLQAMGKIPKAHQGARVVGVDEGLAVLQRGEAVLSRQVVSHLDRALAPVAGRSFHQGGVVGGGGSVTLHAHFHGPVGSQLELENWLARGVDNLNRKGRMPAGMR